MRGRFRHGATGRRGEGGRGSQRGLGGSGWGIGKWSIREVVSHHRWRGGIGEVTKIELKVLNFSKTKVNKRKSTIPLKKIIKIMLHTTSEDTKR